MPPSTAAFTTGFCGGRNPESHLSCTGFVTQGSAVGGAVFCTCLCHSEQREAFLRECFEATAWRTVDHESGETLFWRTEIEALAYMKSKEPACENCNGTQAVPAAGGEPERDVDNGYIRCPVCVSRGAVDRLGDVQSANRAVEPAATAKWSDAVRHDDPSAGEGRADRVSDVSLDPVDRNHHLTDQGAERLVTWAAERAAIG